MSQIDCTPDNLPITEENHPSTIDKQFDCRRIESSLKEVNSNNLNLNNFFLYTNSTFSRPLKRSISIDDSENILIKRHRAAKNFVNCSSKLQLKSKHFKRNSAPDILTKYSQHTAASGSSISSEKEIENDQKVLLESTTTVDVSESFSENSKTLAKEIRKNTKLQKQQPIENRLASVTSQTTNCYASKNDTKQEQVDHQQKESTNLIKRKPRKLPSRSTSTKAKRLKLANDSTYTNVKLTTNQQVTNSTQGIVNSFKVATRQQTRKLAFIGPIDSQSIDDYSFADHNELLPGIGYDTDTVISRTSGGRQLLYPIAPSTNTMATLCNIGNTCYLNSVVYTLRFAPFFLHNLHHLVDDLLQIDQKLCQNKAKSSSLGRNVGGLQGPNTRSWSTKDLASVGGGGSGGGNSNGSGSIGNGGSGNSLDVEKAKRQIATEKLHELYHNLYRNEMSETTEAYHTDTFLNAVQDVSSIFSGNQQQDAHEFLMCVLDSIRDTSQRLTKIIADCPDIVLNGFVSLPEKIDQPIVQPTPKTSSLGFFRKRNKNTQQQQQQQHKENNGIDATAIDLLAAANKSTIIGGDGLPTNTIANCTISGPTAADKQAAVSKMALDFFADDFEGVTVSSTKCLSCETITEQQETMIDLSVPITGYENMETIDNAQLFIQNLCITREHFRSENKYRCEECSGLTEAIRTVSYPKLPRLLIIQLKRFSGGMEKINSYIPTPFTLQCFCSDCMRAGSDTTKRLHVYKLYSVITHVGATLSVGHYIAYTCSLGADSTLNEYHNCPIVKRKQQQQQLLLQQQQQKILLQQQQQQSATQISANNTNNSSSNSNNSSGSTEKTTGVMKKLIFGRSKASSSGDVTKSVNITKNSIVNGIDSRLGSGNALTNIIGGGGVGGNSLNGIGSCQSVNCCSIYVKNSYSNGGINSNGTTTIGSGGSSGLSNGITDYGGRNNNFSINNNNNSGNNLRSTSSSSSTAMSNTNISAATANNIDPTWYMCDDDKIKAMSQREFEELLSPNSRKVMVTPYLLFYARTTNTHSASSSPALSSGQQQQPQHQQQPSSSSSTSSGSQNCK